MESIRAAIEKKHGCQAKLVSGRTITDKQEGRELSRHVYTFKLTGAASAVAYAWFSENDAGQQLSEPTIVLSGDGAGTDEQALRKKHADLYRSI